MGKKVYIGNLPYRATEDQLKEFFGKFGGVVEVILITDRATGKAKGFGFVEFDSEDAADKAINEANGVDFEGRPLKVSMAKERTDRGSGDRGPRRPRW